MGAGSEEGEEIATSSCEMARSSVDMIARWFKADTLWGLFLRLGGVESNSPSRSPEAPRRHKPDMGLIEGGS
jgi:hypothetical protein